jgi:hypothetical protein
MAVLAPAGGQIYQQDIEAELGIQLGSVCAPTAFYIEARRLGYTAGNLVPAEFVKPCLKYDDRGQLLDSKRGELSACLRQHYGLKIVSWNTVAQAQDIEAMRRGGYLSTDEERQFFQAVVDGKSPIELVRTGYHVIAGMAPGFGANTDLHAVILRLPSDSAAAELGMIEVIDPDRRNEKTLYTESEIERGLQPGGACSIVLPPAEASAGSSSL